jgi:hypothetical protein
LAAVAAFVINDGDLVMEDVVFIVCDFLKLDSHHHKKKIFLDILHEKIFSDTVARKDLLCDCKKRSFVSVTYKVLNSYIYRIQLLKYGKTQLQLFYTTNISFSILPYHRSHKI